MSAVTIRDFYQKYFKPDGDERHYLIASKICTLFWGIFCVVAALTFAHFGEATRQTTIVLINAVGSLLYGPILAAFVLGLLTKAVTARAVNTGIGVGILVNVYLWLFTPISWLWWNFVGFFVVVAIAIILSTQKFAQGEVLSIGEELDTEKGSTGMNWPSIYKMVGIYFFFIVLLCYLIENAVITK